MFAWRLELWNTQVETEQKNHAKTLFITKHILHYCLSRIETSDKKGLSRIGASDKKCLSRIGTSDKKCLSRIGTSDKKCLSRIGTSDKKCLFRIGTSDKKCLSRIGTSDKKCPSRIQASDNKCPSRIQSSDMEYILTNFVHGQAVCPEFSPVINSVKSIFHKNKMGMFFWRDTHFVSATRNSSGVFVLLKFWQFPVVRVQTAKLFFCKLPSEGIGIFVLKID